MRVALVATFVALSATAAPIATTTDATGASITLTDEQGPCQEPAKLAEWVSKDAQTKVKGCYVLTPRGAFVNFLDGDRADVPLHVFKQPKEM